MPDLSNCLQVAPLARIGISQREALKHRLNLNNCAKLLIIGLGGIPTKLPMEKWPVEENLYYLIPDSWPRQHPHARHFSTTHLSFIDMLASCDALITKPGYGSFSEATCNQIPVLYLRRKDWPEEPFLIAWLQQHGCGAELSREDFFAGNFARVMQQLPKQVRYLAQATGADQAAQTILNHLRDR